MAVQWGLGRKGYMDFSLPVPSFRIQCCQRPWRGDITISVANREVTVLCNWNITYLDLMVSPGMWNGLHITSVKELCNFLNIWKSITRPHIIPIENGCGYFNVKRSKTNLHF